MSAEKFIVWSQLQVSAHQRLHVLKVKDIMDFTEQNKHGTHGKRHPKATAEESRNFSISLNPPFSISISNFVCFVHVHTAGQTHLQKAVVYYPLANSLKPVFRRRKCPLRERGKVHPTVWVPEHMQCYITMMSRWSGQSKNDESKPEKYVGAAVKKNPPFLRLYIQNMSHWNIIKETLRAAVCGAARRRSSGTLTTLRVNFSREVRRPCSVSGWRVKREVKKSFKAQMASFPIKGQFTKIAQDCKHAFTHYWYYCNCWKILCHISLSFLKALFGCHHSNLAPTVPHWCLHQAQLWLKR